MASGLSSGRQAFISNLCYSLAQDLLDRIFGFMGRRVCNDIHQREASGIYGWVR